MRDVARRGIQAGAFVLAAAVATWPGAGPAMAQAQPATVGASAQLHDAAGRLIATATLREASDEVLLTLSFPDRTALTGSHALQIHEVGRCDPPDFASAGRVFNPLNKQHGLLNPDGPMAGDLPSMDIGPGGLATYNVAAPLVKLTSGPAALLRQGGTSLVIFAQSDDDQSQPEGNPGARIACGVIVSGAPGPASLPQAAASSSSSRGPDLPTGVLVGGLGIVLIGAGLLLRRQRRPRSA